LARQIAADAAREDPSTTTWRCVVTDDEHGSVVGVGRPISTPEHDAPLRVAALVRAAEGMCVFPGCSTPARRCDIDHRRPFPVGATCSCNLQPLCRGHHRLKTTGHVRVRLVQPGEDENLPPGTLEWTTRAGHVYRSVPSQPVPPALEPALAGIPARLAELRDVANAQVRDMNANIQAAFARRRARELDEAWLAAPVDDADETVERPPATVDDDPAPTEPTRPLEAWPPSWDCLADLLSA
ncbi:MAG TPA: HNH endonuclease signature motif containing protein, partial [Kineosporiaceae bacterium]|nr:HNH endonuclease signature motif containing protein [Kineosporiaceae bacterium]